jgi:hypothetical protein
MVNDPKVALPAWIVVRTDRTGPLPPANSLETGMCRSEFWGQTTARSKIRQPAFAVGFGSSVSIA